MPERGNPKGLTLDTPARYRIRVKGQPDSLWSDRLADLQATADKDLSRLQADWQAAMAKTNERLDQMQADPKQALQQAQEREEAEAA